MADEGDFREFAHQLLLRFERVIREQIREMREERLKSTEELRSIQAAIQASRDENRAYFRELDRRADEERRRTDDLLAESRAQRQALLHILDRFDDGGAAPAT